MSEHLPDELLRGMPPEDPDFWPRMDARLAAIEAERGRELRPESTAALQDPDGFDAELIDLTSHQAAENAGAARWIRPLAVAAACVLALVVGWSVLVGDDADLPTVTADAPPSDDAGPTTDTPSLTGAELLADAERRDVDPLDVGFTGDFELADEDGVQTLSTVANIFRNDPEILRFSIGSPSTMRIELTSIEETTVLRLVSPSGILVVDAAPPFADTVALEETGEWAIIVEAIDRSDRFTIELAVEVSS